MQQLQQQNVRPISTYDNLSASAASNNTAKPKVKQPQQQPQQQQQQRAGESSGQLAAATPQRQSESPQSASQSAAESTSASSPSQLQSSADNENSSLLCDSNSNGIEIIPTCTKSTMDLNETSHSIAAVRAALSDAKSKFFGINNYETTPAELARTITPPPKPKPKPRPPPPPTSTSTSEPKYQNVPQPAALRMPMSTPKSLSPERSLRYGTTYEQIPLSDLDAPQPSQAVYMSTTVPQNMKGMKIAGRHTPTRNSLRHSRMIVVNNKPHDSIQETYSAHIRNSNLSRQILILQLAIGLLIMALACWIFIMEPRASLQVNPYLSGLFLLLASIVGIILMRQSRRAEYLRSHNKCHKLLLIESYVITGLALIFCSLNLIIAAIEFNELITIQDPCDLTSRMLLGYGNCGCFDSDHVAATTDDDLQDAQDAKNTENGLLENCDVIHGDWKYLLGLSMALNTMGIIATFMFIAIFICRHRNSRKHFNTSV